MTAAMTHGAPFALVVSVIEELCVKIYTVILQCVEVGLITVRREGWERDVLQSGGVEREHLVKDQAEENTYNPIEMLWIINHKIGHVCIFDVHQICKFMSPNIYGKQFFKN